MNASSDFRETRKRLDALRTRQPRDSQVHGIISNLIEQLDGLQKTTDPVARGHLEKFAAQSVELIEQLLRNSRQAGE